MITQEEEFLTTLLTPENVATKEWSQLAEGDKVGPPPTILPTTNNPPQGPAAAPHNTIRGSQLTLEDVCAAYHGSQSLAA